MAETSNPVSPKLYGGAIGVIVGPLLLAIGQAFVDFVSSSDGQFPQPWQTVITLAAALVGAVIGIYRVRDPLRLPTLDEAEAEKLNQ